jgi:hypothetical protein
VKTNALDAVILTVKLAKGKVDRIRAVEVTHQWIRAALRVKAMPITENLKHFRRENIHL